MLIQNPKITEDIPSIVLMSHGYLAKELLQTAKLIAGENIANIGYYCLEEGDNPQSFKDVVEENLKKVPGRKIVLVDLLGGTPCNSFIRAINELDEKCNAVSGMNLPMLLEILGQRNNMNNAELADLALETGKESICNVTERLIGKKY